MGERLFIYPNPYELNVPPSSLPNGPNLFSFTSRYSTQIVTGKSPLGELIHSRLESHEGSMLTPIAHFGEEKKLRVTPNDPGELRNILLKFYNILSSTFFENKSTIDFLLSDSHGQPYENMTFHDAFFSLQRDIAGAVFICDRAITQGNTVYLTLG